MNLSDMLAPFERWESTSRLRQGPRLHLARVRMGARSVRGALRSILGAACAVAGLLGDPGASRGDEDRERCLARCAAQEEACVRTAASNADGVADCATRARVWFERECLPKLGRLEPGTCERSLELKVENCRSEASEQTRPGSACESVAPDCRSACADEVVTSGGSVESEASGAAVSSAAGGADEGASDPADEITSEDADVRRSERPDSATSTASDRIGSPFGGGSWGGVLAGLGSTAVVAGGGWAATRRRRRRRGAKAEKEDSSQPTQAGPPTKEGPPTDASPRRPRSLWMVPSLTVVLALAYFGYDLIGRSVNRCDALFEQTGVRLQSKLLLLGNDGDLSIGRDSVQELSDHAQETALNLQACCVALQADSITSREFLECKGGATEIANDVEQVVDELLAVRVARTSGREALAEENLSRVEALLASIQEESKRLGTRVARFEAPEVAASGTTRRRDGASAGAASRGGGRDPVEELPRERPVPVSRIRSGAIGLLSTTEGDVEFDRLSFGGSGVSFEVFQFGTRVDVSIDSVRKLTFHVAVNDEAVIQVEYRDGRSEAVRFDCIQLITVYADAKKLSYPGRRSCESLRVVRSIEFYRN